MKYHQGKFSPRNIQKYLGDHNKIFYRSGLELKVFMWLDKNTYIKNWVSEEVIIPYRCLVDKKIHRYFPDLYCVYTDGSKTIVEIKPERFTKPPSKRKNQHQRTFLKECIEFQRNISKWEAAKFWCQERDIKFQVWTEKTIKDLGIK